MGDGGFKLLVDRVKVVNSRVITGCLIVRARRMGSIIYRMEDCFPLAKDNML